MTELPEWLEKEKALAKIITPSEVEHRTRVGAFRHGAENGFNACAEIFLPEVERLRLDNEFKFGNGKMLGRAKANSYWEAKAEKLAEALDRVVNSPHLVGKCDCKDECDCDLALGHAIDQGRRVLEEFRK